MPFNVMKYLPVLPFIEKAQNLSVKKKKKQQRKMNFMSLYESSVRSDKLN